MKPNDLIPNEKEEILGDYFRQALDELQEVARKYQFSLKLDFNKHTWYFYPEVEHDFTPTKKDSFSEVKDFLDRVKKFEESSEKVNFLVT